jgi:hypothetical protein
MKNSKKSLYFLISIFFFFSCDVVEIKKDVYYIQETEEENPDTTQVTYEKKVALIEFTGHLCTNCPDAHRSINLLEEIYGDKLIPIAIHAGHYARIEAGAGFTSDYKTSEGTEIYQEFGTPATPVGIINSVNKNNLSSSSAWSSEIDAFIESEPLIGINISNSFSSVDNKLTTEIYFEALENLNSELQLIVCLTEDSIISKQIDDGVIIDDYIHRHVLRKIMTETWGNPILTASILDGDNNILSLEMILNENWNKNNCSVVAFIYDNESKEILNAEEKKILE